MGTFLLNIDGLMTLPSMPLRIQPTRSMRTSLNSLSRNPTTIKIIKNIANRTMILNCSLYR